MHKEIVRAWGMDPEKILVREVIAELHLIMVSALERERVGQSPIQGSQKDAMEGAS